MQQVIIASTNPVKINATKLAFHQYFPKNKFSFKSTSVPSGVANQPLSDQETRLGATNRALNASNKIKPASYWVGIEGGVKIEGQSALSFAWIAIKSKNHLSTSRTSTFSLPQPVVNLIKQGKELGVAMDSLHHRHNSKQQEGAVGILTSGLITRTSYYHQAIILALIPFQTTEKLDPLSTDLEYVNGAEKITMV